MQKYLFWLILISAVLSSIFVQACQKVSARDYVKYDNEAAIPRISIEDAKKEHEAGNAVIIDTRPATSYRGEHIAGSINLPIGSAEDQFKNLPSGKKLILYCSCPTEHTSALMAFQMNQKGVPGTYAMVGGTAAWKSAGYPMENSE